MERRTSKRLGALLLSVALVGGGLVASGCATEQEVLESQRRSGELDGYRPESQSEIMVDHSTRQDGVR